MLQVSEIVSDKVGGILVAKIISTLGLPIVNENSELLPVLIAEKKSEKKTFPNASNIIHLSKQNAATGVHL